MPRAGATYSLPVSSWYPASQNTPIDPDSSNATLEDLATALTGSLARSGAGGMQADLQMNGYQIKQVSTGVADDDAANVGQVQGISANGTAFAALTFAANTYLYATGPATFAVGTIQADGRSLLAAANYAAMRGLLDLEVGVDVMAYSANLALWSALVPGTSATKDTATAAQFRANTADKVLETDEVWSAASPVTLTDAATIAVDMSTFLNATVTLGGNRTLGQPTNTKDGQSGSIRIVQDGTGSRTLAFHSDWKFAGGVDPTLTTTAGATDILFYQVMGPNYIFASLANAVA